MPENITTSDNYNSSLFTDESSSSYYVKPPIKQGGRRYKNKI